MVVYSSILKRSPALCNYTKKYKENICRHCTLRIAGSRLYYQGYKCLEVGLPGNQSLATSKKAG